MTRRDDERPDSPPGTPDVHQPPPATRPFDELPRRSRAPLVFGIVAATMQMAALLWLARCR